MSAQELGDGEVVLQLSQRRVKLGIMRIVPASTRDSYAVITPLRAFDGLQRQPRLAEQCARDRRFAMDELGAAIGGIAELRGRQRSRASRIVTRFPARASSRAAIRPAAPAPTMTICFDVSDMAVAYWPAASFWIR
jgi:hypothetical protein